MFCGIQPIKNIDWLNALNLRVNMKTIIIKSIFVLYLICLFYLQVNAEYIQDHLEIKQILLPKLFKNKEHILFKSYNNKVFCLYQNRYKKNIVKVHFFNSSNKDLIELPVKQDLSKILNTWKIKDFAISKNYLCIIYGKFVAIFKHNDYKGFIIDSIIEFDKTYEKIYIQEETLILASCFFFNSKKKMPPSLLNYDLIQKKINYSDTLNIPLGFELTLYQPKNLVAISENYIAIADVLDYQITFYKVLNLEKIAEIRLNKLNNNLIDYFHFKEKSNEIMNLRSYIQLLKPFNIKYAQIHKIFFFNDSTLLVYHTKKDGKHLKNDYYFDYWKCKNNIWQLVFEDLENKTFEKDKSFDKIHSMYIRNNFECSDNLILHIEPVPFMLIDSKYSCLTLLKIKSEIENYLLENGPRYSIFVERFLYED